MVQPVEWRNKMPDMNENKEREIQKEIEKYFTESTGFGRDKIRNFMDIVNKALKQKGEQIAKLEAQIEKMKCCANCKHSRTEYEHCKTDKHEKWEKKEND
jgi:cell division septum initiation protein DivIVA